MEERKIMWIRKKNKNWQVESFLKKQENEKLNVNSLWI
jgi:hypothetical protein